MNRLPAISYAPVIQRLAGLERMMSGSNSIAPVYYNGYAEITKSLKTMSANGREIEKQLRHREYYLAIRGVIRKSIFSRKNYSLDELFSRQLSCISSVNSNLMEMNLTARNELMRLEDYTDFINANFEKGITYTGKARKNLTGLADKYKERYAHIPATGDYNYFSEDRARRESKRTLSEESHNYRMSLDLIEDLENERKYLDIFEDFCRATTHICERMAEKASRIERHISNTKQAYIIARDQQRGFRAVSDAVAIMNGNISQLQVMLAKSVAETGQILNSSNGHYQEYSKNIMNSLNPTKEGINRADMAKERIFMLYSCD